MLSQNERKREKKKNIQKRKIEYASVSLAGNVTAYLPKKTKMLCIPLYLKKMARGPNVIDILIYSCT